MVAGICRRAILLSLFLITVLLLSFTSADISETSEQLLQLKEAIDAIQSRLNASHKERDILQSDLRKIDLQIGTSKIKFDELNSQRRALENESRHSKKKGNRFEPIKKRA